MWLEDPYQSWWRHRAHSLAHVFPLNGPSQSHLQYTSSNTPLFSQVKVVPQTVNCDLVHAVRYEIQLLWYVIHSTLLNPYSCCHQSYVITRLNSLWQKNILTTEASVAGHAGGVTQERTALRAGVAERGWRLTLPVTTENKTRNCKIIMCTHKLFTRACQQSCFIIMQILWYTSNWCSDLVHGHSKYLFHYFMQSFSHWRPQGGAEEWHLPPHRNFKTKSDVICCFHTKYLKNFARSIHP